jgi:hypothetical protein
LDWSGAHKSVPQLVLGRSEETRVLIVAGECDDEALAREIVRLERAREGLDRKLAQISWDKCAGATIEAYKPVLQRRHESMELLR